MICASGPIRPDDRSLPTATTVPSPRVHEPRPTLRIDLYTTRLLFLSAQLILLSFNDILAFAELVVAFYTVLAMPASSLKHLATATAIKHVKCECRKRDNEPP